MVPLNKLSTEFSEHEIRNRILMYAYDILKETVHLGKVSSFFLFFFFKTETDIKMRETLKEHM